MNKMNNRKTPLMGWASWNAFRTDISEERIMRQADLLIRTGLAEHGYQYVNIDDGFFGGRDRDGRIRAHEGRFPNGMKKVAEYVHGLGLRAGIYADGGDNTCGYYYDHEGNNGENVGLYGHEETDLHTFLVDWDYDFLKVDWCGDLGKKIVYNICRWQFPGEWAPEIADSWRIGSDIAPVFDSVMHQLDMAKPLRKFCGPGHVNDLDMLQIGNGMTIQEDETHFAMWCMMSTPLMIGCDLEKVSVETIRILTNDELIRIDQDAACLQAYVAKTVCVDGQMAGEIWIKDLGRENSNKKAVAFLNRSDIKLEMGAAPEEIGLSGDIKTVRDVLAHVDMGTGSDFLFAVEPHGCKVLVIEAAQAFRTEDRSPQYQAVDIRNVDVAQAEKLVREGAVWVDVRDREEYEKWHFGQAVNIPYTGIHAAAPHIIPDKHAVYILYCSTGKRSYQAAASMACLGYANIFYCGMNQKGGELE